MPERKVPSKPAADDGAESYSVQVQVVLSKSKETKRKPTVSAAEIRERLENAISSGALPIVRKDFASGSAGFWGQMKLEVTSK